MSEPKEMADEVIKTVCKAFGTPISFLKLKTQKIEFCCIRTAIVHFLTSELSMTPAEIAKKMKWNRSSIYHTLKRHEDYLSFSEEYRRGVAKMKILPAPWKKWWQ